jgi:hypothetical protein
MNSWPGRSGARVINTLQTLFWNSVARVKTYSKKFSVAKEKTMQENVIQGNISLITAICP